MLTKGSYKKLSMAVGIVIIIAFIIGYVQYSNRSSLPVIKKTPDFTMKDISGKTVKFSDLNGKVRLVEFMYTHCPDICPLTTYNMVRIQKELKNNNLFGNKVQFVSITFDPVRDTPQVLQDYADHLGMDQSGWIILRGTEEDTKNLANQLGIFIQKQPDGFFIHSTKSLLLVDKSGQIRKIFQMGKSMKMDEIIKDIKSLTR